MPVFGGTQDKQGPDEPTTLDSATLPFDPGNHQSKRLRFRLAGLILASLLAFMVCATLPVFGNAADEPEIRVGVSQDFRPYAFADKNGRPVGYSIDLIQAVARAMGLRVQIKAGTWDQVWNGLAQGQIDVLAIVAKTPDRESQVDFSVPHTETFDAFFVRTGQPAIPNLAAAAGKEIVVRRSDAALKYLPRNFSGKLTFVDTIPQGLALVATGQHDAFLNSKLIGTLEMRENHIQGLTAGPPIPDYKRVFAFAVRKGNTELLEKLNQGLRIVKANGEYDRIYQQWLEVQPENRWQKMVPYLRWAIAAIVLLVVLAGGLQWLVRLRTRQLVRANETISAEVAERRKAEAALQQANATLEQRVAERTAELRQSQEWLRVTLTSIGDAVLAADVNGRITFLNPIAAGLTGWQADEAQGQSSRNVLQIINEETRRPADDIIARVLKEGRGVELANHTALLAKDGREIPIEDSAAPILDSAGKVVGVVLVFHDVTERRRVEKALHQSEARFRSMYERAAVGIQQLANDGRLLMVNAALCRMLGYSESELLGRTVMELTHPDDHSRDAVLREPVLRGESDFYEIEKRYLHRDGSSIWVHVTSSAVNDASGHPLYRVAIVQDRTERKRAEEALLRAEKLASVGRMASTIAHEINNPLETIGHAVYLALNDPETSKKAKSYLELATQELDRVTHITKQTLAFNRVDKTPTLIDLRTNVDSVVKLFAPRLESRGITVEKHYAEVENIRAGGGEIQQVISNLLSNSMDATPNHGKIEFRVSRSIGRNGSRLVRFTIADTGSGIRPERVKKIFEPFFTTKEMVGTGLGLWVTKQIVEKYGATIRVRSKPGRGTVFSIAFVVAEEISKHSAMSV